MTTLAPCRASSSTMAWPMPLFPPVTMATLFLSDMQSSKIWFSHGLVDVNLTDVFRMNGLTRNRFRGRRVSIRLFRELADQVGNEPGPTGLVRCATAAAIVAVEIFVKQDVVLEMGIGLKFLVAAENRAPAVAPAQKKLE